MEFVHEVDWKDCMSPREAGNGLLFRRKEGTVVQYQQKMHLRQCGIPRPWLRDALVRRCITLEVKYTEDGDYELDSVKGILMHLPEDTIE